MKKGLTQEEMYARILKKAEDDERIRAAAMDAVLAAWRRSGELGG